MYKSDLCSSGVATIFTVGHSTRTLEEFLTLLRVHEVKCVVDIRSYPMSRRMPWFQGPQQPPFMSVEQAMRVEALETTLPREGIGYEWERGLGGRRGKQRDDSPNVALRSPAFRNYADYMMTADFQAAAWRLVRMAETKRTAIMCAEAQVYWHCHRMLVSDWLLVHGQAVQHIFGPSAAKPHRLTPEVHIEDGHLVYRGDFLALDRA